MWEFEIQLHSVQDTLSFVALATAQPFKVSVNGPHHQVNGKSFMEMFCLNLRLPLKVTVECTEEQYRQFLSDAARFLVK